MLLERRSVSQKTPRDGRLEVSARTAELLGGVSSDVRLELGTVIGRGTVTSMACECGAATGAVGSHRHFFVDSPLFQSLVPESEVRLELDAERKLLRILE